MRKIGSIIGVLLGLFVGVSIGAWFLMLAIGVAYHHELLEGLNTISFRGAFLISILLSFPRFIGLKMTEASANIRK